MTFYKQLANQAFSKSPVLPTVISSAEFSDNLSSSGKINSGSSSGYAYNSGQKCIVNTRSDAVTYLNEGFSSLNAYTVATAGTATIVQHANGLANGDPDIANYVEFDTNSPLGATCNITKTTHLATLPSTFSMDLYYSLVNVGSNGADALLIGIENTANGKAVALFINDNAIQIYDSTYTLQPLATIDGTSLAKLWIQVTDNGDGTHTISVYNFFEFVVNKILTLPAGTIGGGAILIQQQSGANTGRISRLFHFNVGDSVTQDSAIVQGADLVAPVAGTSVNFSALVEDLDGNIAATPVSFTTQIDVAGTLHTISITDQGGVANGVVKSGKSVRLLTGTYTGTVTASDHVSYRTVNSNYSAIHSVDFEII